MINLSRIGHVLLRVADEEASKRFYRDVLGFASRSRIQSTAVCS
jgi:catechol 2,3-dioxygenase-like lactoylglutathione lyase family enzyme